MVSTGTVDMAVRQFFGRCASHFRHFNVEHQCLSRQRVVGVDVGGVPPGLCDGDSSHAVIGAQLHHVARA